MRTQSCRAQPLVAERLLSAGGQAVNSVSDAQDFSSAYEQLSQFFSGYIDSEEFSGLTDDILDQLAITTAKLRLQVGVGSGIAARLAEGAKVRGDISVVGGMSCELDLAAVLGGRVSLRTVLEGTGDVLDNPMQYLPDCPLLLELYDSGGGTAAGLADAQGTAGGSSASPEAAQEVAGRARRTALSRSQGEDREQASASRSSSGGYHVSENYPEDARYEPVTLPGEVAVGAGQERAAEAEAAQATGPGRQERLPETPGDGGEESERGGPVIDVEAEAVDTTTSPIERQPRSNITLRRVGPADVGSFAMDVVFRYRGRLYRTRNIPMRQVSIENGSVTFELDSQHPYRVTPPGVDPGLAVPTGYRITRPLSEVD